VYLQGNNFKLKVVLKSATYNKHLSTYLIISVTVVCLFDTDAIFLMFQILYVYIHKYN